MESRLWFIRTTSIANITRGAWQMCHACWACIIRIAIAQLQFQAIQGLDGVVMLYLSVDQVTRQSPAAPAVLLCIKGSDNVE